MQASRSTPACPIVFGVLTTDTSTRPSPGAAGRGQQGRRGRRHRGRDGRASSVRSRRTDRRPKKAPDAAPRPAQGLARAAPPSQLFEDADLAVTRSSDVDYRGDDRRPARRRRAHPAAPGDPALRRRRPVRRRHHRTRLGGGDGADVVTLTELHYSKATARPDPHGARGRGGLAASRRSTDLPRGGAGAHRVPRAHPPLLRASTASTPTSRCRTARPRPRCPTSPTPSSRSPRPGRALRAAGLRILDTILVSYTELIANPTAYADPEKRKAMEQIQTLLTGALEARGRVLVKLNVDGGRSRRRDRAAPGAASRRRCRSCSARTASRSRPWCAKSRDQHAHPRRCTTLGATGIIELPIAKIVP